MNLFALMDCGCYAGDKRFRAALIKYNSAGTSMLDITKLTLDQMRVCASYVALVPAFVIMLICHYSSGYLSLFFVLPILFYFIRKQIYYRRAIQKKMWVSRYLLTDSYLHAVLSGEMFIVLFSVLGAAILSFMLYVSLMLYSGVDFFLICLATVFVVWLRSLVEQYLKLHLREDYRDLIVHRIVVFMSTMILFFSLILSKFLGDLTVNYHKAELQDGVSQVKASVIHSVKPVRNLLRTIRYIDFRILKLRDDMGFPAGWLAYVIMLAPNTLSALSIILLSESLAATIQTKLWENRDAMQQYFGKLRSGIRG